MLIRNVNTKFLPQRTLAVRAFLHSLPCLSLTLLLLLAGCSAHPAQSPAPPRPTLAELDPNVGFVGDTGTLHLRGTNFTPGATIGTPPGLYLRNIHVDSPMQITADYTIASNSFLGFLNVTVTTPGGTSAPTRFTIYPAGWQPGLRVGSALPTPPAPASATPAPPDNSLPPYESLDVGIHAAAVPNPGGPETDTYLDVSFTDDKGHPVAVGDSYHSDMDNVDNDSDDSGDPGPSVTSYSFGVQSPAAGAYVLHIKSSRNGSFDLEMDTTCRAPACSYHRSLAVLETIPTYPGSSFELRFICHRDPFSLDLDSGGLQPPHGAFSFAQPVSPDVTLPAEQKALALVIYFDPVMDPASFHATLDGADRSSLFHVRPGELELVSIPLGPGQHNLTIRANAKSGLPSEQQFHVQH